jgi:small subunit ribosomal protein S7
MPDEVKGAAQPQQPDAAAAPPAEQKKERKPRVKKAAQPSEAAEAPIPSTGTLLFGKYDFNVEIRDPSLRNYVNLRPISYPSTFRRGSQKRFSKATISIVERLANDLMRGGTGGKIGGKVIRTKGRLQGKKAKTIRIISDAFTVVQKQTGKNPLQVLIYALEYSAPIEDTTRVRYGGIISNIAVDVSASRRLDIALRNIAMAAVIGGFDGKRTITATLANELVLASKNDVNSYAIKRKNEIERMARSAK